jgi:hypothetical protein
MFRRATDQDLTVASPISPLRTGESWGNSFGKSSFAAHFGLGDLVDGTRRVDFPR